MQVIRLALPFSNIVNFKRIHYLRAASRLAPFVGRDYFFAVNSYAHHPSSLLPTLVFSLLCCGCDVPKSSAFFVEVAAEVGLDFRHTSGASGDYFLIETMGAGAAFFDSDNDGWLDVAGVWFKNFPGKLPIRQMFTHAQ